MDVDQDAPGNETVIAEEIMNGLGEPQDAVDEVEESHDAPGNQGGSRDTLSVQKRLKAQKRTHDREMRELQSRMDIMQSQLQQPGNSFNQQQQSPMDNGSQGTNVNDIVHQAVSYALQQREMEERKAKEAEAQQHIVKQYADLNRHLDATADKYDDFEDIVRGDAPFTSTMRDAALMLPKKGAGSAGEVLYQLGKNPENLSRIAKLQPVEQAAEIVALSHALISGGEQKQSQPSRPLGQIKSNPVVNSAGITDKTPVSSIRDRMKKGTFK